MLVRAKCVTPAWDSVRAVMYMPGGGPLPEGLYEIDRDGPLASLKLGSTYVFDFDRNDPFGDKPHDYSCKKEGCGRKFKTLAALGTHTRSDHKDDAVVADEEEPSTEEEEQLKKITCEQCGRVCRTEYGKRLHIEKSHPFQPIEAESEAETAVPA